MKPSPPAKICKNPQCYIDDEEHMTDNPLCSQYVEPKLDELTMFLNTIVLLAVSGDLTYKKRCELQGKIETLINARDERAVEILDINREIIAKNREINIIDVNAIIDEAITVIQTFKDKITTPPDVTSLEKDVTSLEK